MANQGSVSRPVQVFLNTEQFLTVPERSGGGGNKDFFEGNDRGFSRHKSEMCQKIQDAFATLRRNGQGVAFIIVQMSSEALATSYRPFGHSSHPPNRSASPEAGESAVTCK